jgi:hypothetical protein
MVTEATQSKVHFRKAVSRSIFFLSINVDAVDIALPCFYQRYALNKHTAGTTSMVYQDAIFDTKKKPSPGRNGPKWHKIRTSNVN